MATLIAVALLAPIPIHEATAPEKIATSTPAVVPPVPAILAHIGDAESGHCVAGAAHQFNADGSVVHGDINPHDIGKYQINEDYNGELARSLGYDIYTERGNTLMALYLYKTRGTQPWNWSKNCWGKYVEE